RSNLSEACAEPSTGSGPSVPRARLRAFLDRPPTQATQATQATERKGESAGVLPTTPADRSVLRYRAMVRYALAFAALSLLACNGCNHDGQPPPNSGANPAGTGAPSTGEVVVQAEDDGKAFDVARGATVTFKLQSNAGTGFMWMPTQV